MMRLIGQIFWLPATAFATGIEAATGAMRELGRMFDGEPGARVRDTGNRPCRDRGDDRSFGLGKPGIKLVEYTIVNLRRDHEQIVDRGQTIVREPTTEEAFSTLLIDQFTATRRAPATDGEQLQVYCQILDGWRAPGRTG